MTAEKLPKCRVQYETEILYDGAYTKYFNFQTVCGTSTGHILPPNVHQVIKMSANEIKLVLYNNGYFNIESDVKEKYSL